MGVPAFFRWLTLRYPKIVLDAYDEQAVQEESMTPDQNEINLQGLNDSEYVNPHVDNVYFDMNGIIHPCTHPTSGRAPKTETEMFNSIFEYVDRLIKIVRPKRLIYFAIDGVAPRAKINQQRSRRFRGALEEEQKKIEEGALGKKKDDGSKFDKNVITPGTEFMERLSVCLKFYAAERLQTNPLWKGLKIIYSDASVPGEGEHKILDYIRSQRNSEGYDANQAHCIYGADADLIMLGLSTHEARFYIIREVFIPPNKRKWVFCGIMGHEVDNCEQYKRTSHTQKKELTNPILFQYVKIHVLREYLELELEIDDGIHNDIDNKIDDFIFLWFFVGNDFLPHLPSFRIRNGAIDLILSIYKNFLPKMNGYLTNECSLNMENVNFLLQKISLVEEELGQDTKKSNPRFNDNRAQDDKGPKLEDQVGVIKNLRDFARGDWRLNYYQSKFHIEESDLDDFLAKISKAYLEGINWVYKYYYTGVRSWDWFYPFHYAPLAIDLLKHAQKEYKFSKGVPYRPVEQLMSVLPKQSSHALPSALRPLLYEPDSEIIDFYPIRFPLDTNGFKFAWMGVNLLPFVNEERLLKAVWDKEDQFEEADKRRNTTGCEQLMFNFDHIPALGQLLEKCKNEDFKFDLKNEDGYRLCTKLGYFKDPYLLDADIPRPRSNLVVPDIGTNKVLTTRLDLPYADSHKWSFLEGTKPLPKEVDSGDLMQGDRRTFMGETSIRVLEKRLGIQRDQSLIYQSACRSNQFASGYYNDVNVRGGYNYNPNSGVPVKRGPEVPAYQLGRQSYQQHKRVKTGNEAYDFKNSPYPGGQYGNGPVPGGHYRGGPPMPNMMYPPSAAGHYPYQPPGGIPPGSLPPGASPVGVPPYGMPQAYGSLPNMDPNANVRPPPTSQYSNFDRRNRQGGRPEGRPSVQDKRDNQKDRSSNRFSSLGDAS